MQPRPLRSVMYLGALGATCAENKSEDTSPGGGPQRAH
jgi:hypothetical protein